VRTYTCSNCHETKTESVSTTGHSWPTTWQKDETNHWRVCNNDSSHTDTATHVWGATNVIKEATETEEGLKEKTCTVCGYVQQDTIAIVTPDHQHSVVTIPAREPTCTESGLTAGVDCETCGYIITPQTTVPATGHNYPDTWTVATPATCLATGVEERACTVCGEKESRSTAKSGHTIVTDVAVSATCTVEGKTEGSHCSVCGEVIVAQTAVPATGHTYGDWVIETQPTESSYGIKVKKCVNCDDEIPTTIAKLVKSTGGTGSVIDLDPLEEGKDYELEISIEAVKDKYNISGTSSGYAVSLWVTEDGNKLSEYGSDKVVTLSLMVPEGMDNFDLYKLVGDKLQKVDTSDYTISNGIVTLRTPLSVELVFNNPDSNASVAGAGTGALGLDTLEWWKWLLIAMAVLLFIILLVLLLRRKKQPNAVHVEVVNGGGGASNNGGSGSGGQSANGGGNGTTAGQQGATPVNASGNNQPVNGNNQPASGGGNANPTASQPTGQQNSAPINANINAQATGHHANGKGHSGKSGINFDPDGFYDEVDPNNPYGN
jgi:hypothetical protein